MDTGKTKPTRELITTCGVRVKALWCYQVLCCDPWLGKLVSSNEGWLTYSLCQNQWHANFRDSPSWLLPSPSFCSLGPFSHPLYPSSHLLPSSPLLSQPFFHSLPSFSSINSWGEKHWAFCLCSGGFKWSLSGSANLIGNWGSSGMWGAGQKPQAFFSSQVRKL